MEKRFGLSGTFLKWVGIITMLADHIGAVVLEPMLFRDQQPGLPLWETAVRADFFLRCAGRLAMPLFCFLAAQGFVHTRNKRRYLFRMAAFALVSEIPFDLAAGGKIVDLGGQNIFFSLFLGLAALYMGNRKIFFDPSRQAISLGLWTAACCIAAQVLQTDYTCLPVLLIVWFYWAGEQTALKTAGAACLFFMLQDKRFLIPTLLSLPLTALYNGRRGRISHPLAFYWFYPVHLSALAALRQALLLNTGA